MEGYYGRANTTGERWKLGVPLGKRMNAFWHSFEGLFKRLGCLLYPPHCAACQQEAPLGTHLCMACQKEAQSLSLLPQEIGEASSPTNSVGTLLHGTTCGGRARDGPPTSRLFVCLQCSRPFDGAAPLPGRCPDCQSRNPAFTSAVAAKRTSGVVRELIHCFKYEGGWYLAPTLAGWMEKAWKDPRLADPPPGALIPVPLHRWKEFRRGYNQSLLLARALAPRCRIPVVEALERVRDTGTQTRLHRSERMRNLRGAFRIRPRVESRIRGIHVVLVDDVLTTGATLDACASVLKRAGAESVRALAVARG